MAYSNQKDKAAAWRRWYHANIEHARAYGRAKAKVKNAKRRAKDPEGVRKAATEASRKFRAENPGYHAKRQAAARALNPGLHEARSKASRKKHPETQKAATYRKRARKAKARGTGMTGKQWLAIIEEQDGYCAMCDGWFGSKLTPEHIVPITKDGAHDIFNIVGACVSCNSKKWHYWPEVKWYQPWARPFVRATVKWHKANPLSPSP